MITNDTMETLFFNVKSKCWDNSLLLALLLGDFRCFLSCDSFNISFHSSSHFFSIILLLEVDNSNYSLHKFHQMKQTRQHIGKSFRLGCLKITHRSTDCDRTQDYFRHHTFHYKFQLVSETHNIFFQQMFPQTAPRPG